MFRIVFYAIYVAVCAGAFLAYVKADTTELQKPSIVSENPFTTFLVMMLVTQVVPLVDLLVKKKRIEIISAIYFGLLIGTLLSYLTMLALNPVLDDLFRPGVQAVVVLMLVYGCISLLIQTRDQFRFVIPYVEFSRELKGGAPLVLDASALIDGRIADVIDTRILDADLVVPQFVLHEVQEVADSRDKMRRTRGRRGLDVLSKLQNNPHVDVRVREDEPDEEGHSGDHRLVEIAKKINGRIVTGDFNLNKVASLQGVAVVNLNDVANALKPRFLPGERLKVAVIKEGESAGQGVGYLDDGTMVVVEQTAHLIGQTIDLIVTSVLQSSAGRMIFGRQVFTAGGEESSASESDTVAENDRETGLTRDSDAGRSSDTGKHARHGSGKHSKR